MGLGGGLGVEVGGEEEGEGGDPAGCPEDVDFVHLVCVAGFVLRGGGKGGAP